MKELSQLASIDWDLGRIAQLALHCLALPSATAAYCLRQRNLLARFAYVLLVYRQHAEFGHEAGLSARQVGDKLGRNAAGVHFSNFSCLVVAKALSAKSNLRHNGDKLRREFSVAVLAARPNL